MKVVHDPDLDETCRSYTGLAAGNEVIGKSYDEMSKVSAWATKGAGWDV